MKIKCCFLLLLVFLGCEKSEETEKVDPVFSEISSSQSTLDRAMINRCKQCSYNEDFYMTFELFLR